LILWNCHCAQEKTRKELGLNVENTYSNINQHISDEIEGLDYGTDLQEITQKDGRKKTRGIKRNRDE
jgi:hypothetical protein